MSVYLSYMRTSDPTYLLLFLTAWEGIMSTPDHGEPEPPRVPGTEKNLKGRRPIHLCRS